MNGKKYVVGFVLMLGIILAAGRAVLVLADGQRLANSFTLRSIQAGRAAQQESESAILSLTATDSPVLAALADEYAVLDTATFAQRNQSTARQDDADQPTADLTGITAVFADLSGIQGRRAATNPIMQAALQSGVPIVLTNVSDARTLGAVAGFGLVGQPDDLFVLEQLDETTIVVHHVGDVDLTMEQEQVQMETVDNGTFRTSLERLSEADLTAVATELDVTPTELQQFIDGMEPTEQRIPSDFEEAEVEEVPVIPTMTMAEKTAVVQALISSDTYSQQASQIATTQSSSSTSEVTGVCNPGSCMRWVVAQAGSSLLGSNAVSITYPVGSNQQAGIDVRFTVTLYDSAPPAEDRKYLVITSDGHITTGGMAYNNSKDRGYYNDRMQISVEPIEAWRTSNLDVHLLKSSPANENGSSSYNVSESITIGADISGSVGRGGGTVGGGVNGSYTAGWSLSRPLSNYSLENLSNPFSGIGQEGKAQWRFKMATSADGTPYRISSDLVRTDGCRFWLDGISSIGKNNLQPVTLSIWDSPGNYNRWVKYRVQVDHRIKRVRLHTDTFICDVGGYTRATWYNNDYYSEFWVNYGAVNNQ